MFITEWIPHNNLFSFSSYFYKDGSIQSIDRANKITQSACDMIFVIRLNEAMQCSEGI